MLTTVQALAIARLIEGDWTDARALDLPTEKATGWAKYVINRLNPQERQAFIDNALGIAERLSS